MTLLADLFRRCRDQQQPRSLLCQLLHELVILSRIFCRPVQVMRLIYGYQIPAGSDRLGRQPGLFEQQVETAQHELLRVEQVALVRCIQPLLIKQGKMQIETAQHFNQPLM